MRDLMEPITPWRDVPFPELLVKDVPKKLEVKARIVKKTEPPIPDAAELYPNTTTYTLYKILKVVKVEGRYPLSELLVVEWVQKDLDPMDAFDYMEGDEHHLVLIPLRDAEEKDSALRSAKFVNEVNRPELPAFWMIEHKE
jgi:hypothetical protein